MSKTGSSDPSKTWPLAKVGVGAQLNSGVATYIAERPGAIGFVEYGYALQAGFTNAAIRNKAGAFGRVVSRGDRTGRCPGRVFVERVKLRHHQRAGCKQLPAGQLQLDAVIPKAGQCQYRDRVATAIYLRDHNGAASGGQAWLCAAAPKCGGAFEVHLGEGTKLERQIAAG